MICANKRFICEKNFFFADHLVKWEVKATDVMYPWFVLLMRNIPFLRSSGQSFHCGGWLFDLDQSFNFEDNLESK